MLEITTTHYLVLSLLLFTIGAIGIMSRRSMIVVLMCIELILNAVNINFVAFSYQLSDLGGQIFSIFTIAVAAGEAAVGLAILVALFRLRQSIEVDRAAELKG